MPSFARNRSTSPSTYTYAPNISSTTTSSSGLSSTKAVGFPDGSPITSISRPLSETEAWTLYYFETHARTCPSCHDPLRVHKAHGRLCSSGHVLAQDVALILYSKAEAKRVYAVGDDDGLVQVEIPRSYIEIKSLLRAMERSLRRQQTPIISYDGNHYASPRGHKRPRTASQGSTSLPRRAPSTRRSSFQPFESDLKVREPQRSSSTRKASTSKPHGHRHAHSIGPLTEGLASLAVRSQSTDLSSDDSLDSADSKSSRRARPSTAATNYSTDIRRPTWL